MSDGDVPGQEFCDAVDRMVRDVGEDVSEVVLRVDRVELGRSEQRVDRGSSFSSGVRACEKIVFAAERHDAQRTFGCVVVDLDRAIVEVACERSSARERVTDRSGHIALSRESLKRPIEPDLQFFHHRPGTCLSDCVSDLWRASAHLFFDGVEQADAPDGL